MKYLFNHAHLIIDEHKEYLDGALLIDDERIEEVFPQANKINITNEYKEINVNGNIIMPGFFDTHIHNVEDTLELAKNGTTSFIESVTNINKINKHNDDYSRYMGTHLEGPFINEKYLNEFINTVEKPNIDLAKQLIADNSIKQMTIAIELENTKEIIKLLKENNIKVMVGHSDAMQNDLTEDVDGITHLFNSMKQLDSKELTLANAAFTNKYYCELNCEDVSLEMLKLIINNIDKDKIMLISNHSNMLINQLKQLNKLNISYTDMLRYTCLNAFKFYGLDKQYGSLVKGKYSDLVILDDELSIKNVMVRGKLLYD